MASEVRFVRLDSESEICGLPALRVRSFFRQASRRSYEHPTIASIQEFFSIPEIRARQVIEYFIHRRLLKKGYTPDDWQITEPGARLGCAHIQKPIHRRTADRRLSEFLERVRQVNSDSSLLCYVRRVAVFGSYLTTTRERINDLDLAVLLQLKIQGKQSTQARIDHAKQSARRFKNIVEMLCWPEHEVWMFLKSRSQTLELHEWSELEDALAAGKMIEHKIVFEAADGSFGYRRQIPTSTCLATKPNA
jgi:predicted nucleotidyltransferase